MEGTIGGVAVADLDGVPWVPWNPPFSDNLRISQPMALCFLNKYK